MQIHINDLYTKYYNGGIKRSDFVSAVYTFLVNNQDISCLCHWPSNEYEDFISWFYPRLQKCVDSYKETGASFEAFMNKFILVASREYHTRSVVNAVTEYSTWSARVTEMYAHEEPPVYKYENKDSETKNTITKLIINKNGKKNTRRILSLILKCYYYVSDDFSDMLAPLIGMKPNELLKLLNAIRTIRQEKDNYIYQLRERIFCQYYRCMVIDKRISLVNENTITYKKLLVRQEKARQRLEKMRHRMSCIRTEATNSQIANVIGVKKGTVDSSLFQLKMQWKKMAKNSDLN